MSTEPCCKNWLSQMKRSTINESKRSTNKSIFLSTLFSFFFFCWRGPGGKRLQQPLLIAVRGLGLISGIKRILGDPGAVSGVGKKSKTGEEKIRAKKSQERLFLPFLTFLRANFFLARFRLFPAPTNCPWVSEDERAIVVV